MKKWIALLLVLVLTAAMIPAVAAAEAVAVVTFRTVCDQERGDIIPGNEVPVRAGDDREFQFEPNEGYEVVMVLVDGYPVSYVYELEEHCKTCAGCETCDWIDWTKVYDGFENDDWSDWRNEVTFFDVDADHVIFVDFAPVKAETPEAPAIGDYTDLDADAWYAPDVAWILEAGLMNGMGGGKFQPDSETTRAQLVTMLWRLEGQPTVDFGMDFADVSAADWYAEAVRWAASEQIVTGSGGAFAPSDPITREQLAAILWRYAQYKGLDVSVGENTNILSYSDAFDVSAYACPALQWACGAGVLNGVSGSLLPQGPATRAQTAAMLHRFLEQE